MAQVTYETTTSIDHLLRHLFGRWEQNLPEAADEWEAMDRYERNDFLIDWPVAESSLGALVEYANQNLLSDPQRERYNCLLALIAANRPILDRLMEGW